VKTWTVDWLGVFIIDRSGSEGSHEGLGIIYFLFPLVPKEGDLGFLSDVGQKEKKWGLQAEVTSKWSQTLFYKYNKSNRILLIEEHKVDKTFISYHSCNYKQLK
jgi:hypothetical protein